MGSIPVAVAANDDLYYVHSDQLGTPRLVSEPSGSVLWTWISDPFGDTAPNEDPDGDGDSFTLNLRHPGQYRDSETDFYQNWHRYYDPRSGRYITSDPIGLKGGPNTYSYGLSNPILYLDPDGLEVRFICRELAGLAQYTGKQHCFVHVTCPSEGWAKTFSLFGAGGIWPNEGYKAQNDPRDNPHSPGNEFNAPMQMEMCFSDECEFEKTVVSRYESFPDENVPYDPYGPNSNSFAQDLATGTSMGGALPPGAPSPDVAPGIDKDHPNFP